MKKTLQITVDMMVDMVDDMDDDMVEFMFDFMVDLTFPALHHQRQACPSPLGLPVSSGALLPVNRWDPQLFTSAMTAEKSSCWDGSMADWWLGPATKSPNS